MSKNVTMADQIRDFVRMNGGLPTTSISGAFNQEVSAWISADITRGYMERKDGGVWLTEAGHNLLLRGEHRRPDPIVPTNGNGTDYKAKLAKEFSVVCVEIIVRNADYHVDRLLDDIRDFNEVVDAKYDDVCDLDPESVSVTVRFRR